MRISDIEFGMKDIIKILVLLIVFTYITYAVPLEPIEVGSGFWMCLDYIREGTLYGGQLFCAQLPFLYYYGYLVMVLFGVESVDMILHITCYILDLMILYLVYKIFL